MTKGDRLPHPRTTAAIRFASEAYDIARPRIMGRQSAGHSFLRAIVSASGGQPVSAYGLPRDKADLIQAVGALDPEATTRWLNLGELERRFSGVCHRPDVALGQEARLRLRAGPARYCLTGVTHTTASPGSMAELANTLVEPLMPWDALICTSAAVAETVRRVQAASTDYLRWRLGDAVRIESPQLPVIPLGIHCADFVFDDAERAAARAALELAADDVLALFVGRRSFGAKAHPQAMYQGLQAAASSTGVRVVLAECGWSPTERIANAHINGAALFAPSVRHLMPDGQDPAELRRYWAAADLFVSLSDNVQETFGLTPLEAMAAGLPVVATDWNGYRDTVRSGVDGFLIPTWAPAAGFGDWIAKGLEIGSLDYDAHNWSAASTTSLDMAALVEALSALISQPGLRRQMGEAGQARARDVFDWTHVIRRYEALWGELNARRLSVTDNPGELAWVEGAPRFAPPRLDPFAAFGHYPTQAITAATMASLAPGSSLETYRAMIGSDLWFATAAPEARAAPVLAALADGPAAIADLAPLMRANWGTAVVTVATLAKMGLLRLG